MTIKDIKIDQIVKVIWNGYYLPKWLSGYTAKVVKINKKLIEIEIISKNSEIPNYKVGIENILKS